MCTKCAYILLESMGSLYSSTPLQPGGEYSSSYSSVIYLTYSHSSDISLGKILFPPPSGKRPSSGSILHPHLFYVLGEATIFCNLWRSGLEITLFSRETWPVTGANYPVSRPNWFTTPGVVKEAGSYTGTPAACGACMDCEGTKSRGSVSPITPLIIARLSIGNKALIYCNNHQ